MGHVAAEMVVLANGVTGIQKCSVARRKRPNACGVCVRRSLFPRSVARGVLGVGEMSTLLEVLVRRRGILLGVWSSLHAAGMIAVRCGEVLFVFNVAAKAVTAVVVVYVPVGLREYIYRRQCSFGFHTATRGQPPRSV